MPQSLQRTAHRTSTRARTKVKPSIRRLRHVIKSVRTKSGHLWVQSTKRKDCARGSPPKTRYSGHQNSRLMRGASKQGQTKCLSYYMREGWKDNMEGLVRLKTSNGCEHGMTSMGRLSMAECCIVIDGLYWLGLRTRSTIDFTEHSTRCERLLLSRLVTLVGSGLFG